MSTDFGEKKFSPTAEDGMNFGSLYEPSNRFKYNHQNTAEKVYEGENNTFIVLGRDRMGESGYGNGSTGRCGSIDIVAGRMSLTDARTVETVNPSPVQDASRLYLSQKSDVDKFFYCPAGVSGYSEARAAAVLKSDDVRIIARNSLKIILKCDENLSTLANGVPVTATNQTGLQLIGNAKNDTSPLQRMVKGDNLAEFLSVILKKIQETNAVLTDFMNSQTTINSHVIDHSHISVFPGENTSPSPELLATMRSENEQMYHRIGNGIRKCSNNLAAAKAKYLISGKPKYINSSYHYLN
jgi:hypothetical protein